MLLENETYSSERTDSLTKRGKQERNNDVDGKKSVCNLVLGMSG